MLKNLVNNNYSKLNTMKLNNQCKKIDLAGQYLLKTINFKSNGKNNKRKLQKEMIGEEERELNNKMCFIHRHLSLGITV